MFVTVFVRGKYCTCMNHLEKCIERKTRSLMCQVIVFLGFGKEVLSVKIHGTKRKFFTGCIWNVLNLGR